MDETGRAVAGLLFLFYQGKFVKQTERMGFLWKSHMQKMKKSLRILWSAGVYLTAAEGNYQIMFGNPVMMKEGEPANLTVYDERVESYSELDQDQSKVLMKIEDGKIVYRKRHPNR